MRTVETTAKTIEEAKQLAAEELGVPLEEIEFEILDEGGKGFLGRGRSARVKATADVEPRPEDEQQPSVTEVGEEAQPAAGRGVDGLSGQTEAEWALSMVEKAIGAAGLDLTPRIASESGGEIIVEISGPDVAILIGKHGQTLDALQYLLGVALHRVSDRRTRVTLDAEGYRDRHAQMLTVKAQEYARRVKQTGEEAVLDPQSPRDRRIMHVALADDTDIYTYSEGDGSDRHVVISPRK
ncbi:MAG: RNA-binding cell elongation regulator Jag/EloR [Armatimonadota bacterium]|nr:RNA-binding cell elongation regulator Jag/EloR [Armatimonadota bacterium]